MFSFQIVKSMHLLVLASLGVGYSIKTRAPHHPPTLEKYPLSVLFPVFLKADEGKKGFNIIAP